MIRISAQWYGPRKYHLPLWNIHRTPLAVTSSTQRGWQINLGYLGITLWRTRKS